MHPSRDGLGNILEAGCPAGNWTNCLSPLSLNFCVYKVGLMIPVLEDSRQAYWQTRTPHAQQRDRHIGESSAEGGCHSSMKHFQNGPWKETEQCVFGTMCPREGSVERSWLPWKLTPCLKQGLSMSTQTGARFSFGASVLQFCPDRVWICTSILTVVPKGHFESQKSCPSDGRFRVSRSYSSWFLTW